MNRAEQALALICDLESASNVGRAIDLFQLALEPFGVKVFRTSALSNPARDPLREAITTNWSDEWFDFYMGQRAFLFDPTIPPAWRQTEGFFWGDVPESSSIKGRQLMADAASVGMVEGFVAIRAAPGQLKTAVYLSGGRLDWTALERGVVSFVANTMMSRLLHLRDVTLTPSVLALSPRETEVLLHAACGRSDKEIARELEMAFGTVRYHWGAIHRKLQTMDRANAVAIGLWSGQIAF